MAALTTVMQGQDVVYANHSGDMRAQTKAILPAMRVAHINRLIFFSTMGIFGEVPCQRYQSVLDPNLDAALVIDASDLGYSILRPAWLSDDPVMRFGITHKNGSLTVSR